MKETDVIASKFTVIKIGDAARSLGVTVQTLRRWEEEGHLIPYYRSAGGTRYYSTKQIEAYVRRQSKSKLD